MKKTVIVLFNPQLGVLTFSKNIYPKVNVLARLDFELSYYDVVIHQGYPYTTRTENEDIFHYVNPYIFLSISFFGIGRYLTVQLLCF